MSQLDSSNYVSTAAANSFANSGMNSIALSVLNSYDSPQMIDSWAIDRTSLFSSYSTCSSENKE